MKVHFIGAGPGDPELITVRGQRLVRTCKIILYAGSLVPLEILHEARADARVLDTAPMTRPDLEREYIRARDEGEDVARVHSGDPSLYGAIAEQTAILRRLGIEWETTPGVPAFAAAAAAIGQELTLPGVSQTLIITRTSGKASPMPPGEELASLAASKATLALHLSARNTRQVVRDLAPHYGETCPVVAAYCVGHAEQDIVRTTLSQLPELMLSKKWTRTVLFLIGHVLDSSNNEAATESALYDPKHPHIFRPHAKAKKAKRAD